MTNSGWIQNLHYFSDLLYLVIEEEDPDFLEFEMADPKYANLPGIVSLTFALFTNLSTLISSTISNYHLKLLS